MLYQNSSFREENDHLLTSGILNLPLGHIVVHVCKALFCDIWFKIFLLQCVGRDGMDIFTYAHALLKGPVGLSVDAEDNIYIAGYISNNIHQVTPTGELSKILLNKDDGMREPKTVFCQRYTNRFVVCDSRKVKICTMKPNTS